MADTPSTSAQVAGTTIGTHDFAMLLLRLALGLLLLMHGIGKLETGPGIVLDIVSKAGLPVAIGYLVYVGEVAAPLLLIFGVWTRAAAIVIAINMIVAVLLVHTGQLLSLSETGGYALELQAMYFFVAVAIALLGAGQFRVGRLHRPLDSIALPKREAIMTPGTLRPTIHGATGG